MQNKRVTQIASVVAQVAKGIIGDGSNSAAAAFAVSATYSAAPPTDTAGAIASAMDSPAHAADTAAAVDPNANPASVDPNATPAAVDPNAAPATDPNVAPLVTSISPKTTAAITCTRMARRAA